MIRQGSPIVLRSVALVAALALTVLPGCLGEGQGTSSAWLQRFRPFQGVTGPNAVHMDVALIELPYADASRYRDLWNFIDESDRIVSLEKKAILEENGFRVGLVGGNPPGELLELLTNKRTCPGPRRIQIVAGQEERCLEVGPVLPATSFQVSEGGQLRSVDLIQAQCCLTLAPSLADEGRVRIQVTPKVRHSCSNNKVPWKPSGDRSGWMLNLQQPLEAFPAAGFEVSLAPGEYLIVGARQDRPATLGCQTFVRPGEAVPVQRLLVLRAWRPNDEPTLPEGLRQGPVPLVVQASRPSMRGVAP